MFNLQHPHRLKSWEKKWVDHTKSMSHAMSCSAMVLVNFTIVMQTVARRPTLIQLPRRHMRAVMKLVRLGTPSLVPSPQVLKNAELTPAVSTFAHSH